MSEVRYHCLVVPITGAWDIALGCVGYSPLPAIPALLLLVMTNLAGSATQSSYESVGGCPFVHESLVQLL